MITLILKVTDGCNLRCKYCSIGEKSDHFNIMNVDTMKSAGDFAVKFAKEKNDNNINIILHGGEPTIIRFTEYESFCEYLLKTYKDILFKFSLQTNGYHFTEDFISFLKKYDINVGVSIDGNEKVHDKSRVDINGNGTFDKIKQNIIKLIENEICVSGLVVVTKDLLKEDLSYLNFFNYYDINLKINPLLNYGEATNDSSMWLECGDYSEYLKKYIFICLKTK